MKKAAVFLLVLFMGVALFAQQKHALVIGNSTYTGISRLGNPVNDANDMEAALKGLGFTVEKVLNGNLDQMETAVMNLVERLKVSQNSYGFFYYAGHGVQAGGSNYLIPVTASNILSENHLRERAVSVQTLLDNLNDAGNELNMVVLDACRDNPFGWARGGSRGLSLVSAPAGSIVMYATSANSTAADGTGRNGLFTGQLLTNLKTPGLSVYEVFDKTGEDVLKASGGIQNPEISLRYFAADSTYLGERPAPMPESALATALPATQPTQPVPALPAYQGEKQKISNLGYGFMNLALGLGSYVQGDWVGGLITTGGWAAALGFFIWGYNINQANQTSEKFTNNQFQAFSSLAFFGATTVFGFIRPYIYSNKQAAALNNVNIGLVSNEQNNPALRIGYTHRF